MKVRENQTGFSSISLSYLNFDFYYMLRGYRVSSWSDDIKIGGSNFFNANFLNIGQQIKIIDTTKYFRTSIAQIASTVTSEEKERIKKLMLQFLVRHYYFIKVWQALNGGVKENILDVLSDGKGMIPSEKSNWHD